MAGRQVRAICFRRLMHRPAVAISGSSTLRARSSWAPRASAPRCARSASRPRPRVSTKHAGTPHQTSASPAPLSTRVPVFGASSRSGAQADPCAGAWPTLSICATFAAKRQAGPCRTGVRLLPPEGYRQEFSVDWPEAPQCRLVGSLDDRQLRWHTEFAGELRDRCEFLTASVQPE
jgi:hypothetical protein